MASCGNPMVRQSSKMDLEEEVEVVEEREAASTSDTMATVATVFLPRLPLMETVSPSKTPSCAIPLSVIPTTLCPPPLPVSSSSSLEYRYTFMVFLVEPVFKIIWERSVVSESLEEAVAALEVSSGLITFFFFLEEEEEDDGIVEDDILLDISADVFFFFFFFLGGSSSAAVDPPRKDSKISIDMSLFEIMLFRVETRPKGRE
mmetsp:Transcript_8110/g.11587  ORF Transcript_8110/g.11587 Transcript_8110/m.11587 type:complete len:203 (-) Transcript_8110:500-1108(-)